MSAVPATSTLLKAALRRDRVMITATVLLLPTLVAASDRATRNLYPPGAPLPAGMLSTMRNAAFVAVYGPLAQPVSIDAIGTSKVLLPAGLGIAILAQVIVRRHTRADEESGLAELIGAQIVGRHAALTAAVALATGAVLVTAALGCIGLCLVGAPATGAVDFGLCWVVIGLIGTGIEAVSVQVASSTRGAGQLGLLALGALYVIRMLGDTTAPAMSWSSPIGWASKSAPFGGNHYWIALPGLAAGALLLFAAYRLLDRRDLGAGILPQRHGAAHGRIAGTRGLVWRLLRGTVAGWLVCFGALGAVVGCLIGTLSTSADAGVQNMLRTLGGGRGSFTDLYVATEISVCALIATAAGITVTSHLATEERARRLELLLAGPLSRRRLLTPYVIATLALPAGLMLLFSTTIWVAARLTGAELDLESMLRSAVLTLPATWVVTAAALLLFAVRLEWAPFGWAVLVTAGTAAEFGGLLSLPTWARAWSPFDHLAAFPADHVDTPAIVLLTAIAALTVVVSVIAFERRQID